MKNSFTLLFVFLSVCFVFSKTIICKKKKKGEGRREEWEIHFRGYAKENLSSTLTLSAASDTVPRHEAGYFGTFLTWSWLEEQLLQFAEHLMARRALHFSKLRKLKESCKIVQFLLKLKSPVYNRGILWTIPARSVIWDTYLWGHCFSRDLWWVTSHQLVQHPSQDTSFLWATKQE